MEVDMVEWALSTSEVGKRKMKLESGFVDVDQKWSQNVTSRSKTDQYCNFVGI
jgi:hypothetical protein